MKKGTSKYIEEKYGYGGDSRIILFYKNKHKDTIVVSECEGQKIIMVYGGRYERSAGLIDVPLKLRPHFGIHFECYPEMRKLLKSKSSRRFFTRLISSLEIENHKMSEFMNGGNIDWDKTISKEL